NGYAALLAVPPHHLRLVVLLLALDRAVLALGHVLALGRDDEVVDRGAGEVLEGAAEQRARRSIGGEAPTVGPGHDHCVRARRDDFRGHSHLVECRVLRGCLGRWRGVSEPPGRRRAPTLAHEAYEPIMASLIRLRLFSAASVMAGGSSPRSTQ